MTLNCLLTRSQSACETFGYGSTGSSPFAWPLPSPIETGTRSMYTRRKRCLPIFHSTSTTSSPSERATLSAASRIFSNCKQRLPSLSRFHAHSNRPTKKWACAHPVVRPVTERSQSICPGQDKSKAQGPRAIHGHLKRNRVRPEHSNETQKNLKLGAYGFGGVVVEAGFGVVEAGLAAAGLGAVAEAFAG